MDLGKTETDILHYFFDISTDVAASEKNVLGARIFLTQLPGQTRVEKH